jgi:hypothetical protein
MMMMTEVEHCWKLCLGFRLNRLQVFDTTYFACQWALVLAPTGGCTAIHSHLPEIAAQQQPAAFLICSETLRRLSSCFMAGPVPVTWVSASSELCFVQFDLVLALSKLQIALHPVGKSSVVGVITTGQSSWPI